MTARHSKSFVMIPTDAVFDKRLTHGAVHVLAALAAYVDKEGRCWPSTTTMANKTGMSERHARTCLRDLENLGYVETKSRPGQSSIYHLPRNSGTGVSLDPGTQGPGYPGTKVPLPRNLEPGDPGTEVPTNYNQGTRTKNHYAFEGKIIRLTQADYDTWAKAYQHIDLGAQLQALDDYYDRNLTGKDRADCFWRCSQALAKKNERARAEQAQQREEPKFNDGVY